MSVFMGPELYNVTPLKGFSPTIGKYLTLMDDVRARIIEYVKDLNADQLSWFANDRCESIGTLLLHIAAVERSWIGEDIFRKPMGEEWKPAFALRFGMPQISGKELTYYLEILKKTREETKEGLTTLSDADLTREVTPLDAESEDNAASRFTVEWILYHVLEHEAHHKGQIALMKRVMA